MVSPFEARILSAFILSIALNSAGLLIMTALSRDFMYMKILLPSVTAGLLVLLAVMIRIKKQDGGRLKTEFEWSRFFLYCLVFVILIRNGGLIEQLADSWWHMALAKKISWLNSIDVRGHLNGIAWRYYPSLWHANLALLHEYSGVSLPLLWNAFTAWGSVFKVMGFYLLAFGLCGQRSTALLSAALFFLLPGLGDAYMRVSAWPSHVTYVLWFCSFYVLFVLFDGCRDSDLPSVIKKSGVPAAALSLLFLLIYFLHRLELVWIVMAVFFYAILLLGQQVWWGKKIREIEPAWPWLRLYLFVGAAGVLILTFLEYRPFLQPADGLTDFSLLAAAVVLFTLWVFYLLLDGSCLSVLYNKKASIVLLCLLVLTALLSVDLRQLMALFRPELSYPTPVPFYAPSSCTGWLGGSLKLAGWHNQLRSGLLYSGIFAVFISPLLAFVRPTRATLFLAANAVISFLAVISPYFFEWLTDILNYTSPERIAMLIFHPIILAYLLVSCWEKIVE